MRNITAKLISKEIANGTPTMPGSPSDLSLRVYPPQRFLDSTHNVLFVNLFKNGTRVFSYRRRLDKLKSERIPDNESKFGFFDLDLTMAQARHFSAAVRTSRDNAYEAFLSVAPDRMSGITYKLAITETDQLVVPYPTQSLPPAMAVTREGDLPSRGSFSQSFTDDPDQKTEVLYRNKNDLSNYDNNVSLSYYLVDTNTIRVALTNLPVGYQRVEVLAKKSGQYTFNADSIKKIREPIGDQMSNWFFNRIPERGNGFTDAGGYVVFDLQMFADERNTIIERVNRISQNFFRNARGQDGQLGSQPVTGLPLFPEPVAHAGELADIRIKLHGDLGREKSYTVPLTISTMGYSKPRMIFSSNPVRSNRAFRTREIMTSNPINESNEAIYRENITDANLTSNDIFIDLNMHIIGQVGIPGAILELGGATEDAGTGGELSTRLGGSFLVALVSRYDSITGNTFDLGFTAKNKVIDRISDLNSDTSLANVIGSTFGGTYDRNAMKHFLDRVADQGLNLVYNFDFHEVTPEMFAAYQSADSVTDEEAAPLLQNIGIHRRSDGEDFNSFISNLLRARTPIQRSSISMEYATRIQAQPDINVNVVERQQNTNIPFYEVIGQVTTSAEHVAFVEVFRVEESRIVKRKLQNESRIPGNFSGKEIRLGTVEIDAGRFIFRDFTPKDNIEGSMRSRERSVKTYYKIVPYGYVSNNGLLTNSLRKLDTEILVGR